MSYPACRVDAPVGVHAAPAGESCLQPAVHQVGERSPGRVPDSSGQVEGHSGAVGRAQEEPHHDLRQAQSIPSVGGRLLLHKGFKRRIFFLIHFVTIIYFMLLGFVL